jgi:hypothetical protein
VARRGLCQGRLLSKAATKETRLRFELEGLSCRSFTESRVPISSQYPELFALCGVIVSAMPTTACVAVYDQSMTSDQYLPCVLQ